MFYGSNGFGYEITHNIRANFSHRTTRSSIRNTYIEMCEIIYKDIVGNAGRYYYEKCDMVRRWKAGDCKEYANEMVFRDSSICYGSVGVVLTKHLYKIKTSQRWTMAGKPLWDL